MASDKQAHINAIRKDYGYDESGTLTATRAIGALQRSTNLIATTINSDVGHFLLELIQNADDNKYSTSEPPTLEFKLIGTCLLVSKNEGGFTFENADALCDINKSDKKMEDSATGEKGIGFKSVFKAGYKVVVSSNGYEFSFDTRRTCGMLVPENGGWPAGLGHLKDTSKTQFLIELSDDAVATVRGDLEKLEMDILLFLRRVEVISIDNGSGAARRLSRSKSTASGLQKRSVQCTFDRGSKIVTKEYWYFSDTVQVIPIEEPERLRKPVSDVAIAIPFTVPSGQNAGAAHKAYCCLPIRTSGLPFPIQAEFRLTASREDLDRGSQMGRRNSELLQGVANLYLKALAKLVDLPDWRYKWTSLLPLGRVDNSFSKVVEVIRSRINGRSLFFAHDGSTKLPASDMMYIPESMRFNSQPFLPSVGKYKKGLSTNYILTQELRLWVGLETMTDRSFLAALETFVKNQQGQPFQSQSAMWHEMLAKLLVTIADGSQSLLRNLAIVPLTNGTWAKVGERIFFPPTDELDETSEAFLESFQNIAFVAEAALDGYRCSLLRRLGIKNVSASIIYEEIQRLHNKGQPPTTDPDTLLAHARYLYKHRHLAHATGQLWVVSEDKNPVKSDGVFLHDGAQTLSNMLLSTVGPARLLHRQFRSAGTRGESSAWLAWLKDSVGVRDTLKIVANDRVTNDFKQAMNVTSSKTWLPFLVDNWPQVAASLSNHKQRQKVDEILRCLKEIQVDTQCGVEARLCDTYLPTPALLSINDPSVKFLAIEHPGTQNWDTWAALDQLGVICTMKRPEVAFKVLRSMKRAGKPDFDAIRRLYWELQGYLGKPKASQTHLKEAHTLFHREAHIWIPADQTWRNAADCVWSMDFALHFKICLGNVYPTCQELFVRMLQIEHTNLRTVMIDIASRPTPKDESDTPKMMQLLSHLAKYIDAKDKDDSLSKIRALQSYSNSVFKTPLVPVKMEGGPVTFKALMDDTDFLVCDRKAWEGAFPSSLVLPCTAAKGVALKPLFDVLAKAAAFTNGSSRSHMMSDRVLEEFTVGKGAIRDIATTNDLRTKMCIIQRVVTKNNKQLTAKQRQKLSVGEKLDVLKAPEIAVIPFFIAAGSIERVQGEPRRGGQFLPPDTYLSGKCEVYVDDCRLKSGAAFMNQLLKDLMWWLDLTDEQSINQIRDILTSDDINQVLEDLTLAGYNMKKLNVEKIADITPPASPSTTSSISDVAIDHHKTTLTSEASRNAELITEVTRPSKSPQQEVTLAARPIQNVAASNSLEVSAGMLLAASSQAAIDDAASRITDQTGIDGEQFVAELLSKIFGVSEATEIEFFERIWTSELRHLANQQLSEWVPYGKTAADFTVKDENGVLKKWIAEQTAECADNSDDWGDGMLFHIEVKATKGKLANEFHMSGLQVDLARAVSIDKADREVFVVFRVYNMNGHSRAGMPKVMPIINPLEKFINGEVDMRSPEGWLVSFKG